MLHSHSAYNNVIKCKTASKKYPETNSLLKLAKQQNSEDPSDFQHTLSNGARTPYAFRGKSYRLARHVVSHL